MSAGELLQFLVTAAASGIIGNRMDATVAALGPVQRLHAWFRARLIDPALVQPSSTVSSWLDTLNEEDRKQLRELLREAVDAAPRSNVGDVNIGNNMYGNITCNFIGTQNNISARTPEAGWEYVSINYGQEGDFDNPGQMKWAAYIKWPGASRLDVRDHARMPDILNELGRDGWELVSERPAIGINTTDYTLRRERR